MTRMQKDAREILEGNEIEVFRRRQNELRNLERELRTTRNGFRAACIRQEIARLNREYETLDDLFEDRIDIDEI